MTSVVACYMLGRRRDNPVSEALLEDYRMILEWLKEIAGGAGQLVDLIDTLDHTPFVSNMRVDGSYPRSNVRVVQSTSTRAAPGAGIRRAVDARYYYFL